MSETLGFPNHRSTGRDRGRARSLLLGAVLGLLITALGVAITVSTSNVVRAALAGEAPTAEAIAERPTRELPPEWRWAGKAAVDFEHMYRHQESPRLDWIRVGRAR